MRKTLLMSLPVALLALSAPQVASAMPIDGALKAVAPAAEQVTYYGYYGGRRGYYGGGYGYYGGYGRGYYGGGYGYYPRSYYQPYSYNYGYYPRYRNYYRYY